MAKIMNTYPSKAAAPSPDRALRFPQRLSIDKAFNKNQSCKRPMFYSGKRPGVAVLGSVRGAGESLPALPVGRRSYFDLQIKLLQQRCGVLKFLDKFDFASGS